MPPPSPGYSFVDGPDAGFFRIPNSEWFWRKFFNDIEWEEYK